MHGNPADVIARPDLNLACMNPNPHVQAERLDCVENRLSTANGSGRTIEGRPEPVLVDWQVSSDNRVKWTV